MKKKLLLLYLLFFLLTKGSYAQQLVINEVSQGASGNKEYVELIVSGVVTCSGTNIMDLRNYIIDDNNGTFATGAGVGIAQGCVRLKNIPFWSNIPFGTLILIYNDNDINPSIPANDLSMIDGNCKLVIPISDCALLERYTTQPSTALATYPASGYTNCGGLWNEVSMANGGDSFQTVNTSGGSVHSVSWGNNTLNNVIYFAGSAAGNVIYNTNVVNTNPFLQANWVSSSVAGNETPGVANNSANAAWINSMNNNCTIITPFSVSTSFNNTGCLCTGSASANVSGAIPPYTYSWMPGNLNTATLTNLCAGNYTLTATSANSCVSTSTLQITGSSGFTATANTTSISCFGNNTGSATITAIGGSNTYTYTWFPSVSTSSLASNLAIGTYSVLINDINGCQRTVTFSIVQPSSAINATITSSNSGCTSATGSASVIASGGNAGYTYNWQPSGGTNTVATSLSAGIYSVIVTDANACSFTATTTIFSISGPTLNIVTNSVTCFGLSNGSANAIINGGTAPISYSWLPLTSTLSSVSGLVSGSYTLNILDANNCGTSNVFQIAQPNAVNLVLNASNITCHSFSNGSITANVSGGVGMYSYSWSPSVSSSSLATNLSQGIYSVTVSDNNNCIQTASVQIMSPVALTASVTTGSVSCNLPASGSATVIAQGGTGSYSFNWQPNIAATNSVVQGLTAGTYSVIISDALACSNIVTFSITAANAVNLSVNTSSVNCKGNSTGSITVLASGGVGSYQYVWQPSVSSSSVATNLAAGVYVINALDVFGCGATETVSIAEPLQFLNVSGVSSLSICNGQNATITTSVSGGNPQYTYNWQPISGNSNVLNVSPSVTTVYSLNVIDATNCLATIKTVTVNVADPLTLNAVSNVTACNGALITLTALANSSFPNTVSYTWLPINLVSNSVSINVSANAQYTVVASDVCSTRSVVTNVVVESRPIFTNFPLNSGCEPLCVNYMDNLLISTGTIKNWQWSFSDGQIKTEISPNVCFNKYGNYTGTLTVLTVNNCSYSFSNFNSIKVSKKPIADFTSSLGSITTEYNSDFIFTNNSLDADSITWFAPNNTIVGTSIVKKFDQVGVYSVALIAIDKASGCADTVVKQFTVKPEFTFFAPNCLNVGESAISKVFLAKGTGWDETKFTMSIYDRWGELIFKTTDCYQGWDGTYKGLKVKDDVYVWKVDMQDLSRKSHNYVGHITIIR